MHRYEQVDGTALDYDLTGNLLTDGSNSYSYDVLNRQISMIGLDSTAEYVYDALGRRVATIVDGVTTYDVYNAGYQVIEERDSSNQLLARYTYGAGIDEPLTMERGGQTYYYHRDALGSITEVTDASGALVERYEYDVYGAAQIFDTSGNPLTASAIENPYLFTGRRYDPESGNYYYRARIYSPTLGRFLQTDPLGYVDGLNLYAYVGNNPASWVDPWGEEPVSLTVLTLWGLAAGAVGITATTPAGQEAMEAFAEHVVHALKTFPQNARNVYEQVRDLFGPETLPIPEPLPTGAVNIPVDLTDVLAPEILYPGDRCPFEQPEQILPVDMPPLITVFPTEEGNPVFDPVMTSKSGTDIALGLTFGGHGKPGTLKRFADAVGAKAWTDWAKAGLTHGKPGHFANQFKSAAKKAKQIHFNLDGIDNAVTSADLGKKSGFSPNNMTNAELNYIRNNPSILEKTVFYRNGQVVSSPF